MVDIWLSVKAPTPIVIKPSGSVIDVRGQFSNAASGISVTPFGMLILFRLIQFEKHLSPSFLIDDGRICSFRLVQLENAFFPISSTPSEIVTEVRAEQ